MARIDLIVQKVLNRASDSAGRKISPEVVIEAISDVQRELALEALAIKDEDTFVMEAGTDTYEQGYQIVGFEKFFPPAAWRHPIVVVTGRAEWERLLRSTTTGRGHPTHVTCWDKRLHVWPTPTVTGDELHVWLYRYPTVHLELGKDPETAPEWDKVLELGALAELVGGDWMKMYERKKAERKHQTLNENVGEPLRHEHSTDRLGF